MTEAEKTINALADIITRLTQERDAAKDLLSAILKTAFTEDCQECAIGQTPQWKEAKAWLRSLLPK